MEYSANGAVFNVSAVGSLPHEPHYYYMIDALAPGNYTAVFQMTSSVARDFRFNIILPDSGYASILEGSKYDFNVAEADEMVTVTVNFNVANPLTNVKVELDFGTFGDPLVGSAGIFTLHNILIYQNFN
jgi:hypothetical protein